MVQTNSRKRKTSTVLAGPVQKVSLDTDSLPTARGWRAAYQDYLYTNQNNHHREKMSHSTGRVVQAISSSGAERKGTAPSIQVLHRLFPNGAADTTSPMVPAHTHRAALKQHSPRQRWKCYSEVWCLWSWLLPVIPTTPVVHAAHRLSQLSPCTYIQAFCCCKEKEGSKSRRNAFSPV